MTASPAKRGIWMQPHRRPRIRLAGVASLLSLALAGGCGFDPAPGKIEFGLSPATHAALADAPEARAAIEKALADLFGTPAEPRLARLADGTEPFAPDARESLGADRPSLARSAEIYRVECLACHGASGAGDGPTAAFLDPKPRDFRPGIFKFTALGGPTRPRLADLLRTLERGLLGTAMPSFARLSLPTREGLAEYVRYLSIRGETEIQWVATYVEEGVFAADAARDEYATIVSKWRRAPEKLVVFDGDVPPATAARIARGAELFHDATKGNCASCHGAAGRGDGVAAYKVGLSGERVPAYLDAWGAPILPRDLTRGLFRGGSRPIDVYRRIHAGIPGGPMPALGEAKDAAGAPLLSADDLWCLAHYVLSLSDRREGS